MKVPYIEVEATAEEIKASRTISDCLANICSRFAEKICNSEQNSESEVEE